jgi:hypothetical protein
MLSSSESSLVEDQRARVAAGPRIMVGGNLLVIGLRLTLSKQM